MNSRADAKLPPVYIPTVEIRERGGMAATAPEPVVSETI